MPTLISKAEAAARIAQAQGEHACALCALCARPRYVLAEGSHCIALLPQYARRWGHVMILFREHITTYQRLSVEAWTEANVMALAMAQTIERALSPLRCYVASLGAAIEHPMTFPHLHLHVIPIYDATDTPSTVLTTKDGVLTGEEHEWETLFLELRVKSEE
jgi:diadenosine tetraphosphate (Ap4A) HIT family hydrolase